MQSNREIERLKTVYEGYRSDPGKQGQWCNKNPGNRAILQERQIKIQRLLEAHHFLPLDDKSILEIGCGNGTVLASLMAWGAKPQNLHGIDLLPERIQLSKKAYPDLHFQCLNAENLDFPSATFDLILSFTVFSSILDENMRVRVAAEAGRVLKKGGAVLWYDFRYDNPVNPHVRGVTGREIRRLFPEYAHFLQAISLVPPLARRLGKFTATLYPLLSRIGFLRSHHLGILLKKP